MTKIRSYEQANEYLGKKDSRPLRYKTRVNRRGENIAITHHNTDIITYIYWPGGIVIIDTEGWHTSTTKERLNCYLPERFHVYQEDSIWYLERTKTGWWSKYNRWVFADGMKILPDGTIEGAGPPVEELKALNKEILKYSRDYIKALFAGKVGKPSNGDCWDCLLRTQTGRTMGEMGKGSHLLSHFEEKYYVPSLLVRAIEIFPVSRITKQVLSDIWGMCESQKLYGQLKKMDTIWDHHVSCELRSALRRYLRRQLGLAS